MAPTHWLSQRRVSYNRGEGGEEVNGSTAPTALSELPTVPIKNKRYEDSRTQTERWLTRKEIMIRNKADDRPECQTTTQGPTTSGYMLWCRLSVFWPCAFGGLRSVYLPYPTEVNQGKGQELAYINLCKVYMWTFTRFTGKYAIF